MAEDERLLPPGPPRGRGVLTPAAVEELGRGLLGPDGDPGERRQLHDDWRAFVAQRFRLTPQQSRNLAAIPAGEAAAIQDALRSALASGGSVSFTPATGSSQGSLAVHGALPGGDFEETMIKIPLIDCSFNADCTGWHCGPPKPLG